MTHTHTPTRNRALILRAAAAVTLALLVVAPNSASAQDDPLAQTIDPNQSQGSGQVILERGHIDFGPTLATGEWKIQIHDDTGAPSYWRDPQDVVLKVNDQAILTVPDSDSYAFLGQEPGTAVWVVPQTQHPDVIWAGWNTQEPRVLDALRLGATLSVRDIQGPGEVIAYLQSGNFGEPQQLWSTLRPFPQEAWIEVNIHAHANWVFTEPGIYLVDIEFAADLVTGESVVARDTLRFAVGDSTAAEAAFTAALDRPSEDAEPEPVTPDAVDDAAAHPADTDQGGESIALVIGVAVGAIALVLLVAAIVVAGASRRAKERAFAMRGRSQTHKEENE